MGMQKVGLIRENTVFSMMIRIMAVKTKMT